MDIQKETSTDIQRHKQTDRDIHSEEHNINRLTGTYSFKQTDRRTQYRHEKRTDRLLIGREDMEDGRTKT